jgi:dienelactone hydrolase
MTKISFSSADYKLAGNLFVPVGEPKKLAFLFIQGWTGHQNIEAAQALTDLGYITMTYDMRGNGESEGELAEFSRADFIEDAIVAYDYLQRQAGNEIKIGVVGSSFGIYTAVLLALKRAVACLSLRVPASYPDEGYETPQLIQNTSGDLTAWRHRQLNYAENRAFQALHDYSGRVLVVEAAADEQVPSQAPQNYANAVTDKSKLTYQVVVGAPHGLTNERLQYDYKKRLVDWVKAL